MEISPLQEKVCAMCRKSRPIASFQGSAKRPGHVFRTCESCRQTQTAYSKDKAYVFWSELAAQIVDEQTDVPPCPGTAEMLRCKAAKHLSHSFAPLDQTEWSLVVKQTVTDWYGGITFARMGIKLRHAATKLLTTGEAVSR